MKTKKIISAFLLSLVLLPIAPPPGVTASSLGVSQPTICIRLPTQPKTKCRKRVIASKQAPQDYADKIDALFNDYATNSLVLTNLKKKFPKGIIPVAYIQTIFNAEQGKKKSLAGLKLLANKFPNYFNVDSLVLLLAEN